MVMKKMVVDTMIIYSGLYFSINLAYVLYIVYCSKIISSYIYLICRKQELRELKMLQKQEQKQFQDLSSKAHLAKEQQVLNKKQL